MADNNGGWWVDREDDPSHGYCVMDGDPDRPGGAGVIAGGLAVEHAKLIAVAPALADLAQMFLDFYGMGTREFVDKYGPGVTTRTLGRRAEELLTKAGRR